MTAKDAVQISSDDNELVLGRGANAEPLTNSAHHSKPFFTGRRKSRRRRVGVVSNRTGADWTEKDGLKESPREGSILI